VGTALATPRGETTLRGVRGAVRPRIALTLAVMFAGYLAELELRSKTSTMKAARSALAIVQRDLGDVPADSIDRLALEEWRRSRAAAGRSNRTINRDLTTLGAAYSFALDRGMVKVNPVRSLRRLPQSGRHRRRVARAAGDDEIGKILAAGASIDARHPERFPRTPLLRVLFETGCRWYELVACQWGDLDTDRGVLMLRSENVKTGQARAVPLREDTLATILELRPAHVRVRGENPRAADRIFLRPLGTGWGRDTSGYHRFLHECLRVARIPKADAAGRILPCPQHQKVVRHSLRAQRSARPIHRAPRRN
jgi:site-specific recombinase XerD